MDREVPQEEAAEEGDAEGVHRRTSVCDGCWTRCEEDTVIKHAHCSAISKHRSIS